MDFPATQAYEDEDTQKVLHCIDDEKTLQIGTLNINSIKYQIKKGITKIGRLDTCDIVINDETVSKIHAEIDASVDGEAAFICDLNSSNKTKLNNVVLRPSRLYELKNESTIKFGKVCAIYKVYRSSDDILAPETPVPVRQQITKSVIPDTPDSSFNKSSSADSDASIIIGTPRDKENSVFRRPIIPQLLEFTNVDKENTVQTSSINESNCLNISHVLHMSGIENQETSIFNTEKQELSTDISGNVKPTIGVNLSSSVISEDCSSSPFNQSTHLFESSSLLRYFHDGIDEKTKVQTPNTPTLKPHSKQTRDILKSQNDVKISDGEEDIFDAPAQQDLKFESLLSDSSKTNKKGTLEECKVLRKESKILEETDDSETDGAEKYLEKLPKKQHKLSLSKLHLENVDNINDPGTSIESEDMFDMPAQSAKNEVENTSNLSIKQLQNIDKTSIDNTTSEQIINSIKSTCESDNTNTTDINKLTLPQSNKVFSKAAANSKVVSLKSNHDIDDMVIDDISTDMSKSVDRVDAIDLESASPKEDEFVQYSDQEKIDFENAPTQLIGEIENEGKGRNTPINDSNCGKVISSSTKLTLPQSNKIFSKAAANSKIVSLRSNHDVDDINTDMSKSVDCVHTLDLESVSPKRNEFTQYSDQENIDFENAPTQLIGEIESEGKEKNTTIKDSNSGKKLTLPQSDKVFSNAVANSRVVSLKSNYDIDDINTNMSKTVDCVDTIDLESPSPKEDEFAQYSDQENIDYEMAPTQLVGQIESEGKEKNTTIKDSNCGKVISSSKELTLPQLSKVFSKPAVNSKVVSLKSNHDVDDINTDMSKSVDCVDTIDLESASLKEDEFTQYSDEENIDYEMAPTQLIGEIESKEKEKNTTIKDSNSGKIINSPKKLTLPQSNKLFSKTAANSKVVSLKSNHDIDVIVIDDINMDMSKSVDCVDTIDLESASSKEDEFTQYSDEENIDYEMAPTQLIGEIENEGKEKNTTMKDSNCGKVINLSKEKLNDTLEQNLNEMFDNANNENVYESSQLSTQCLKNILESSQCNASVLEMSLKRESRTSRTLSLHKLSNRIDVNKTENDQSAQTLVISYDSDEDIMTRFPVVHISGTLSNPSSSSVASTSRTSNVRSKQSTVTSRNRKNSILRNKLSHQRNIEQSEKEKTQTNIKLWLRDDCSSVVNINSSKTDILSGTKTTYRDSNNETSCKHMTDEISNNELSDIKKRKRNAQAANQSKKERNMRSLTSVLKKIKEDIKPKTSLQTDTRALRYLNRQNKDSLCASHMTEEIHIENVKDKSTNQKTKTSTINKKRSLNLVDKDMEQNSKKYKVNPTIETRSITMKQSPNISEYSTRSSLRKNSSVTESMKCSEESKIPKIILRRVHETFSNSKIDENIKHKKDNVKKIKYEVDNRNNQATVYNDNIIAEENSNRNKKTQRKRKEIESGQMQDNITPVLSNFGVGQESQEVEMIMDKVLDNVHDKYLVMRQNSNAKTVQRELRTRSKIHSNVNKQTKSGSTENILSNIDNSDNIKSDNIMFTTTKKRTAKSSAFSSTIPLKRKIFENRTSTKQHSTPCDSFVEKLDTKDNQDNVQNRNRTSTKQHSTPCDSFVEKSDTKDNQDNVQNKNLNYQRLPRSKTITQKKKEVNKLIDNNTVLGIESKFLTSMASRTRRSVSSLLSNSSCSSTKHRVIFTGITEEKYSKIVKTLGGQKVEHPEKCTILVTDKVRRTYKFLCALAKGVPIVTINWLEDSESAGQFLNWEPYILKDPAAEAKFGFKLRKSLNKTKEKRLLEDYTVLLTLNIVQPPIKELKDMVTCCGGKTLLRPPTKWPEKVVIISCEEDLSTAKKFLTKAPKTITIQSTEFILTGILRQEMDFVKYKLM